MPEDDEFEKLNENVNTFDESLIIPNGENSTDTSFYSICYAKRFIKSYKTNTCHDEEIDELSN